MPKRIDKPIEPFSKKLTDKNINKVIKQSSKKLNKKLGKIALQNMKQHNKEIRRIKRFISNATIRGYEFPEDILTKYSKPTKKNIEKLKQLKPSDLYKQATYYIDGQKVSGTKGRQYERKQAARKAKITKELSAKTYETLPTATELVLSNIVDIAKKFPSYSSIQDKIENWSPLSSWTEGLTKAKENDKNVMINVLNGAIKTQGEEAVARRIEENAVEIESLVMEILYASGSKEGNFKDGRTQVNFDLVRFSSIIMGRSLTPEESIDFTDTVESMEVNN